MKKILLAIFVISIITLAIAWPIYAEELSDLAQTVCRYKACYWAMLEDTSSYVICPNDIDVERLAPNALRLHCQ